MKKFKEFIKDAFPVYKIIPFPIHFKDQGDDDSKKKDLKEEDLNLLADQHYSKISQKLHDATASNLSGHDINHIKDYTNSSRRLNNRLIHGFHPLQETGVHDTITKHAKPSGHSVTLYSGTRGVDFSKLAKQSKDNILHSPAHISATHRHEVATDFSNGHMIAIHVKPEDKILHVSHHSAMGKHEAETIIPAGTKLQYSHSTPQEHTLNKLHHFTIHSQEEHKPTPSPTAHDIDKVFKHNGKNEYRTPFIASLDKSSTIEHYPHMIEPHHIESAIKDKDAGARTDAGIKAVMHPKANAEHLKTYINKHSQHLLNSHSTLLSVMKHPEFNKKHLHQVAGMIKKHKDEDPYELKISKIRTAVLTHPLCDSSHVKKIAD